MFAEQEAIRAPSIKPVIPYITPASTNTIKIVINTFTPDTLAASSFEPTANIFLPNFVLFQITHIIAVKIAE